MKRDSLFYQIFQQNPHLLFELLPDPPTNAGSYRFDSVAVKEPRFEIDGVFLPPDGDPDGVVYFSEVQFQRDERLYERVFAESSLYFYRNRDRFRDWQAVIIYPSRSTEQTDLYPHRGLLNSGQVHRVYLNELGGIRQLPLWLSVLVLTTVRKTKTSDEARYLLERIEQDGTVTDKQAIIELVTRIVSYRFSGLSHREVEAMLGLAFKETRFYQSIKEEVIEEGIQLGEQRAMQQVARNLLRTGMDPAQIAAVTGLTPEQIRQLQY